MFESKMPKTSGAVRAIVFEGEKPVRRISYSWLAALAIQVGERKPSGMSAGQVGAQLAPKIDLDLQPYVSRASGEYHEKALATWGEAVDLAALKALPVLS